MRHLVDVARELFCHVQERHHDADAQSQPRYAQVGGACQQQRTARYGHQHIQHVADIVEDGAQGVGVAVGFFRFLEQGVVEGVKGSLALLFVAEHLDDLLTVHHLLDEALSPAQGGLLAEEIPGRAAADLFDEQRHQRHARQHHQRQPQAVVHHNAEDGQHRHRRHQQLGKTLGDHLPQGVDVVGVIAHDVAMVVGVEIADGQPLHAAEHLDPKFFQRPLGDDGHELVEGQPRRQRQEIEHRQQPHEA